MTPRDLAVLMAAYLVGSFPTAYIVARLVSGIDIRSVGDGNMGAKNTLHSIGRLPAIVVATVDVGKGAFVILMARSLGLTESLVMVTGAAVVLGHDFSMFVGFRGGQGMATLVGVFGMLYPVQTLLALAALATVLLFSRNWDLSCAVGFALLPLLLWLSGQPPRRVLYPILMLPTIWAKKALQSWQARRAEA